MTRTWPRSDSPPHGSCPASAHPFESRRGQPYTVGVRFLIPLVLLLSLLCSGCSDRVHFKRSVRGIWVGVDVPPDWEKYPSSQTAWRLPKKNSFHFQILEHKSAPSEAVQEQFELLEKELSGQGKLSNSRLIGLESELRHWAEYRKKQSSSETKNIQIRISTMRLAGEVDARQNKVQAGEELKGEEATKLLKDWQERASKLTGDETAQQADMISSVNSFISFDPAQITSEPVEANGLIGTLYTVPTKKNPYKFAFFPLDERALVFEFQDMYEPGQVFNEVPAILQSVQLGFAPEDVGGTRPMDKLMSSMPHLKGKDKGRFMLFLLYVLCTAVPAALSAAATFKAAEAAGGFSKTHRERVQGAVFKTTKVVVLLVGGLILLGAGHDAVKRGKFFVLIIVLIGTLLVGLVAGLLVGLGGGIAAGFGASWGYKKRSRAICILSAAAASLVGPLGLALLTQLGFGGAAGGYDDEEEDY